MSAGDYTQFLAALGQNESGNNYSFVSSLGYLGRFQFGEEALQAIGFYAGDATWAIDFTGAWTSKAAAYGVTDKASFLASSAAQDAAAGEWFAKVWADVTSLGLQSYIGQTVGGVPVSTSGLLAGAHLVGVWNLKAFLESGGANLPRDGYGTSVAEYVGRFGGFDTPYGGGPAPAPAPVANSGRGASSLQDDILHGSAGHDRLHGGAGDDVIDGGGAFDDLHGNTGDDIVRGGAGDDWVVGGQGQDALFGDEGQDILLGNLGADTLDGGSGGDVVRGGQGDDLMTGDHGDDWVSGDLGSDTVAGGAGADMFHFFAESGEDRIVDFSVWEGDRVDVAYGGWTAVQAGADVLVSLGEARLTLVGVQLSALPEGWIV